MMRLAMAYGMGRTARVPLIVPVIFAKYLEAMGFERDEVLHAGGWGTSDARTVLMSANSAGGSRCILLAMVVIGESAAERQGKSL